MATDRSGGVEPKWNHGPGSTKPRSGKPLRGSAFLKWAWVELNYRPHAYQACALTT